MAERSQHCLHLSIWGQNRLSSRNSGSAVAADSQLKKGSLRKMGRDEVLAAAKLIKLGASVTVMYDAVGAGRRRA